MLVLDTDHLVEYQRGTSAESRRLKERLDRAAEPYATTIITVEETMRGWMAAVRRMHEPRSQIGAYAKLRQLFRFFATWQVLDWNEAAADRYDSLKRAKARVGTMDLKIASIALANDATLLTRNANDFNRVPGLRIEDWMS
ncbi:MAG: type II toxin-antitoxin system VapC family toxin [Thermoguttaceae bacterium]|jgi:tRNA(fMet)-specific endonuclease VapC